MNQTLHIIKKDVRRLRWTIVVWTVIVTATAGLVVARPALELHGYGMAMVSSQLTSVVSLIELVMMVLIVSWLVHEDPAAEREAFWLTRPINPRRLSAAKLIVATAVLVLLPLLGQIVVMRIFALSAYQIARATPPILLSQAASVMALVAAAALTPSLTRYAVVLVGAVAAFVLFISTMIASVFLFIDTTSSSPRPEVIDPLPTMVTAVIAIVAAAAIVFFQYRYRRVAWGAALASAGVVIIYVLPMIWPLHFRQIADADLGDWARDEARVAPVVDRKPPDVSDEVSFRARSDSKKRIAVPVRLSGLPDDFYVNEIQARSRFEVDGATVVSTTAEMVPVRRDGTSGPSRNGVFSAMQGALGNVRLLGSMGSEEYERWPVLLSATDQEFAQFGHATGRLTSTIDFYLGRATVAGGVPLEQGRTLQDDRRRIDVVSVERRVDGCTVSLRTIAVGPLFRPRVMSRDQFVILNTSRGEAAAGGSSQSFGSGSSSSAMEFLLGVAFGGSAYGGALVPDAPGFSLGTLRSRFPSSDRGALSPAIDAAWLSGAELVRLKIGYAGHLTRTLTIDNFRMAQ